MSGEPPRASLEDAIERLYGVFARYRRPAVVEGCPCCVGAADQAKLHARPLRALGEEELRRYAFKALTTWGTEDDLRHFLPRILELVASSGLGVDPQTVLGKLAYGHWERWPEDERAAIRAFLDAWLEETLERGCGWTLIDVVSSIRRTGGELAPLLARVELEAARSPAVLLELVGELASQRKLDSSMSVEDSDTVTAWLAHPDRRESIERAIEEVADGGERDLARWNLDAPDARGRVALAARGTSARRGARPRPPSSPCAELSLSSEQRSPSRAAIARTSARTRAWRATRDATPGAMPERNMTPVPLADPESSGSIPCR